MYLEIEVPHFLFFSYGFFFTDLSLFRQIEYTGISYILSTMLALFNMPG